MLSLLYWLRVALICAAVASLLDFPFGRRVMAQQSPSHSCTASVYRQFDFWVGDWDVFDAGVTSPVAHARVDLILDGCVLKEDYQELQAECLDVRFIHIDLNDLGTTLIAAETIRNQFGKLNLLINTVMQTNYVGSVAVTQTMLPRQHSEGSNQSSEVGSVSLHNDPKWKYAPVKFLAYCRRVV